MLKKRTVHNVWVKKLAENLSAREQSWQRWPCRESDLKVLVGKKKKKAANFNFFLRISTRWRMFSRLIFLYLPGEMGIDWGEKSLRRNKDISTRSIRRNQNKSFIVNQMSRLTPVCGARRGGRGVASCGRPINGVINGANFTWTLQIITSCSPSPPSSCLYVSG